MSVPELSHLIDRSRPQHVARYGNVPGLPVGSRFVDRAHLYRTGMHATLQAGIQGRAQTGACSVVLSGGYEDDVDLGYEFNYTGHGGQLPRKETDRSQKKHQEWTRGNLALKMSCQLKKPVRVIRGNKLQTKYAPAEGYRYDGLYDVVEYDRRIGKSGFYVCLFRFVRRPDQPPLPEPSQYYAGQGPSTKRSMTSSNRAQPSPTPPPRTPPPHYTPPADIQALLDKARSRQPPKKPSNVRRGSLLGSTPKDDASSKRSSYPGVPNRIQTSMSMSAAGQGQPSDPLSQPNRPLPSFTRGSSRPSKLSDLPKRSSSLQNTAPSSNVRGSIPSSQWKGKQKASAPVVSSPPTQYKYPPTNVNQGRESGAATRIQAWNQFYNNQGIRNEPVTDIDDDDSDSDGGEFSEGEGITYRDEASDTEQPMASSSSSSNDGRTLPFNKCFQDLEVIEISSSDEE